MSRYAHSAQTGKLRLVSILQNIRRTNIDRLVAISYQIPVVDNTSRTGHSSIGIPVTFWLSTQGKFTEDDNQDVILTNGTPGARAEQAAPH